MKKVTTIKVDENVLINAKKQIPNLSAFVEDCLKAYMGTEDYVMKSIEEYLEEIKTAKLNIHLISKNNEVTADNMEFDKKRINTAWLKIWSNYRNGGGIHDANVLNTSDIVGLSYSDLIDMMDDLLTFIPKSELSMCDDFEYAKKMWDKVKI